MEFSLAALLIRCAAVPVRGWRNFRLMPRTLVLTRNKVVPSSLAWRERERRQRERDDGEIGRRLPGRFEVDILTVAAATF